MASSTSSRISLATTALLLVAVAIAVAAPLQSPAQSSSSSNPEAPSSQPQPAGQTSTSRPRIGQAEAAGAAVTLETSEALFDVATALNACGYDAGLKDSAPVRLAVRQEITDTLTASADARDARDAICAFIREHTLTDSALNLAQYVSLAIYLKPPPLLTPILEETDLPADSTQVVNILPLLRAFAETARLHALWFKHLADYQALTDRLHDPLTRMVLNTNIYLSMPVSSYDGRRFMVLLEPMLAPAATNARIYANDYIVVASPAADPLGAIHMDEIRHTYLHYEVEPLVYARALAMERLQPLLKSVQEAPIEFTFKSDIIALVTECLIKAIEAQTLDVGLPKPAKATTKQRADLERFDAETAVYEKKAEAIRRKRVDLSVHQGWVLVDYFYEKLGAISKSNVNLKEDIGEMVYGMDVDRERRKDSQVAFLRDSSADPSRDLVRRAPRQIQGLDLAELKLRQGDTDGAQQMAEAALKANPEDPTANYLAGRVELIQGEPEAALDHLTRTLALSHDPRTLAWAHIYLGRLYDIARDTGHPDIPHPERAKAIAEYQAALTVRDALPDTRIAAEKGLKEPFALPQRAQPEDDTPLDPSGKAEKDAYSPPTPSKAPPAPR